MIGYLKITVLSVGAVLCGSLTINQPAYANPTNSNPLDFELSSGFNAENNYTQTRVSIENTGFKNQSASTHNLSFFSESATLPNKLISSDFGFLFSRKLGASSKLKLQTKSRFDSAARLDSIHDFSFQHRLPTKRASSSFEITYRKREHIDSTTGAKFALNKNISVDQKQLFKLQASVIWKQTNATVDETTQQEAKLVFKKNIKLGMQRSLNFSGVVRWLHKRSTDTSTRDAIGGTLEAKLTLSPNFQVNLTHRMHDDFVAELSKFTGVFSKQVRDDQCFFKAGSDNQHNHFATFTVQRVW